MINKIVKNHNLSQKFNKKESNKMNQLSYEEIVQKLAYEDEMGNLIKKAVGEGGALRFLKSRRERNVDRAREYAEMSNIGRARVQAASERTRRRPLENILFSNALDDWATGSIQKFLYNLMARKAAYSSKYPWRSLIPFSGYGRQGKESLEEILSKK